MAIKSIRIECARTGHNSRVFIDGAEVENCYKVVLDVSVDGTPRLTLGLHAFDLEVAGEADVIEVTSPVHVQHFDVTMVTCPHCGRAECAGADGPCDCIGLHQSDCSRLRQCDAVHLRKGSESDPGNLAACGSGGGMVGRAADVTCRLCRELL